MVAETTKEDQPFSSWYFRSNVLNTIIYSYSYIPSRPPSSTAIFSSVLFAFYNSRISLLLGNLRVCETLCEAVLFPLTMAFHINDYITAL